MTLEDLVDVMYGENVEVVIDDIDDELTIECDIKDKELEPFYDLKVTDISRFRESIQIILDK